MASLHLQQRMKILNLDVDMWYLNCMRDVEVHRELVLKFHFFW